jgi:hypothetical protein
MKFDGKIPIICKDTPGKVLVVLQAHWAMNSLKGTITPDI